MTFQTNNPEVAKLELAIKLCEQVETINNKNVLLKPEKEEQALERAKLITRVYNELPGTSPSRD